MLTLVRDLRYAFRMLLKTPLATGAAALALALGIGLTSLMFSVLDGVVLQGLPFEEADRLLHIERRHLNGGPLNAEVSPHELIDYQRDQLSMESLAGFWTGTVNISGGDQPERFSGAYISPNFLDLLRERPVLGRGFTAEDAVPGAPPVILLGYEVWQNRYASDPDIVGTVLKVNAQPTEVVGVLPPGFAFPIFQNVWMPLQLDLSKLQRGEGITMEVFGRLKDGVSASEARAEFTTLAATLATEYPETNEHLSIRLQPYAEEFIGSELAGLFWTMFGAVLLVFLIACANVANLMLARALVRTRELAVRAALGAGRWRTIRQWLTESFLLCTVGAGLGLLLAYGGLDIINTVVADVQKPYWIDMHVDLRAIALTLGITALATVLAGLYPALKATRRDVTETLNDAARGSSLRLGRVTRILVVAEVALSCALLVGAGLMVRTLTNVRHLDLGADPENLLTFRVGLFEADYPTPAEQFAFFERLLERLEARPEFLSASATTTLPSSEAGGDLYRLADQEYPDPDDLPWVRYTVVTPDYFRKIGGNVLEGREFSRLDQEEGLPVALVNRSFAERTWPNESALGKRIQFRDDAEEGQEAPWRTIVGVVQDQWTAGLIDQDQWGVYIPLAQQERRFMSFALRTRDDPLQYASIVREELRRMDPDLPIYSLYTLPQVVAQNRFFFDFFGSLFAVFGAVALILAAVGLYAVMAFGVSRRTQEIGVRMAFGADRWNVLAMVIRQSLKQVLLGLLIGLPLAFGLSRLLANVLFDVDPSDPVIFGGIALGLALVAVLAALVPARRAAQVDPLVALRYS